APAPGPARFSMTPEQLRQYLTFYQDLGVKNLYRRAPSLRSAEAVIAAPIVSAAVLVEKAGPVLSPIELPPLAPAGDTLVKIREDIGDGRRCGLCEQRNKIVFGSGNEQARLVFVGEGPGADEGPQGPHFRRVS